MNANWTIGENLPVKAIVAVATCLAALALALSLGVGKAWAGGNPMLENLGKKTFTLSYKGKAHDLGYRDFYSGKVAGKKITDVKSSNKKVATAKVLEQSYDGNTNYYLRVTMKKAGTTKISFKHNGKKYATKFVVKKYSNPISSLKVGSTEYASYCDPGKLGTSCYYASPTNVPVKAFAGKVSVKPKSGWKVTSILTYPKDVGYKEIKNGGTTKSTEMLGVLLENNKTGQFEGFYLNAAKASQLRATAMSL